MESFSRGLITLPACLSRIQVKNNFFCFLPPAKSFAAELLDAFLFVLTPLADAGLALDASPKVSGEGDARAEPVLFAVCNLGGLSASATTSLIVCRERQRSMWLLKA